MSDNNTPKPSGLGRLPLDDQSLGREPLHDVRSFTYHLIHSAHHLGDVVVNTGDTVEAVSLGETSWPYGNIPSPTSYLLIGKHKVAREDKPND